MVHALKPLAASVVLLFAAAICRWFDAFHVVSSLVVLGLVGGLWVVSKTNNAPTRRPRMPRQQRQHLEPIPEIASGFVLGTVTWGGLAAWFGILASIPGLYVARTDVDRSTFMSRVNVLEEAESFRGAATALSERLKRPASTHYKNELAERFVRNLVRASEQESFENLESMLEEAIRVANTYSVDGRIPSAMLAQHRGEQALKANQDELARLNRDLQLQAAATASTAAEAERTRRSYKSLIAS